MNRIATSLTAAVALAASAAVPAAFASSHREAPITALDRTADITDVYAFVDYGADQQPNQAPQTVTLMMCVDPLLEPGNGPTLFPFDPDITYSLKVDNTQDALANVTFEVKFTTEYRAPGVPVALIGIGDAGATDPETGDTTVPPQVTSFDGGGFNLRQTYTVTMVVNGTRTVLTAADGNPLYAVPANIGPRTVDYTALFNAGVRPLSNGVTAFAGTVDDPFFIDLGAAFDTFNFRTLGSGVPGVLTADEDSANQNFASDTVSGYAVNAIAVQVPIGMLTSTGQVEAADSPAASIGVWATTDRPRVTIRRAGQTDINTTTNNRQIQRLANPLINELLVGIGSKDTWSRSQPADDAQFASTYLNPVFPQAVEAVYNSLLPGALDVPEPDRTDLLPLVTYAAPVTVPSGNGGPVADLLRLNTGVSATPLGGASRLGLIAGDAAGFPNGRRLYDDVTDIALRVVVGGVLADQSTFTFVAGVNDMLGDGVNVNDVPFRTSFPYLADCPSGRNRRHIDPGESFPDGRPVPVNSIDEGDGARSQ